MDGMLVERRHGNWEAQLDRLALWDDLFGWPGSLGRWKTPLQSLRDVVDWRHLCVEYPLIMALFGSGPNLNKLFETWEATLSDF